MYDYNRNYFYQKWPNESVNMPTMSDSLMKTCIHFNPSLNQITRYFSFYICSYGQSQQLIIISKLVKLYWMWNLSVWIRLKNVNWACEPFSWTFFYKTKFKKKVVPCTWKYDGVLHNLLNSHFYPKEKPTYFDIKINDVVFAQSIS